MNKVCENINAILDKIKKIFKGIHDDLNIKLIEEIIPEDEFNRLRRSTATTKIEGTNKNAHEKLIGYKNNYKEQIKNNEIENINTIINDLNAGNYSNITDLNLKIKNYVKFYLLLKEQKFGIPKTPRRTKTETRDTSKQKILQSIVNLIVTNYEKISYPEYTFLDADKIYKNKTNQNE